MDFGCVFCTNACCNPSLDSYNDLSYMSVGRSKKGYGVDFRSGDRKETVLLGAAGLEDVWIYSPKYCPECGRRLLENKSRWHKGSS